MKFRKVIVFVIVWICCAGEAKAADFSDALVTDRPDTAESSVTVGKHRFQMETSFAFSTDKAGGVTNRTYSFPTLLRFGILEPLELRLEGEIYSIQTQTGGATQRGLTDLAFGAKGHLLDNQNWTPSFGLLFHLGVPTGTGGNSSGAVEPMFKVLADWELPKNFSLGTNVGMDLQGMGSTTANTVRFLYAASIGYAVALLDDRLKTFAELAGAVPLKNVQSDVHTFDTGVAFLLTPNMQLDTFVQLGLTGPTTDITTGVGFSWRI